MPFFPLPLSQSFSHFLSVKFTFPLHPDDMGVIERTRAERKLIYSNVKVKETSEFLSFLFFFLVSTKRVPPLVSQHLKRHFYTHFCLHRFFLSLSLSLYIASLFATILHAHPIAYFCILFCPANPSFTNHENCRSVALREQNNYIIVTNDKTYQTQKQLLKT